MFACLYSSTASQHALLALGSSFSPLVEDTAPGIVCFSILGLGKLIGTVQEIATVVARKGAEAGIRANLAVSADPDTAMIAACNIGGITLIPLGKEADCLGNLPVHVLHTDPEIIETLGRWGIKTLGELAALPQLGFIARFGDEGTRLMRLARGETHRSLKAMQAPENYERRVDFDHRVLLLEPLLFVLSAQIHDLMNALEANGLATNRVTLGLKLERRKAPASSPQESKNGEEESQKGKAGLGLSNHYSANVYPLNPSVSAAKAFLAKQQPEHRRALEFPVPVRDAGVILKQLQFDLEAHPPQAAITGLWIHLNPVEPRALQHGLFIPQAPAPEKLQLTLARLTTLAGEGNVGSPELLDTHQRDAFVMRSFSTEAIRDGAERAWGIEKGIVKTGDTSGLHFAFRYYRPPWKAQVRLQRERRARPDLVRTTAQFAEQASLGEPARLKEASWAPGMGVVDQPVYVHAQTAQGCVQGDVLAAAGPWRTSGDWWTDSFWSRDEWDVELSDGGVYRIYRCLPDWFLEGMYD